MANAVRQLKAEGLSILLAEQNLYFAHAVADRAVIIEQGRIRWEGGMVELLNDESTYQQYLSL
jgi:branched-chain amino acid transport system ATP-binding protein